MEEYTKEVMQHFTNPRNLGEIKNADGIGKVGNIKCGDILWIFIKVGKKKIRGKETEFIKDIKFKTLGCPAAIATTSVMTVLAKGKTLDEALRITNRDIVKALGGLPKIKLHCSLLAEEALNEAIHDYLKKSRKPIPAEIVKKHQRAIKAEREFHKIHGGIHQHE